MGQKAKARIADRFSIEETIGRTQLLYRQLIGPA
jgi:hypothetical protein